jgi:anaphase-promoting complex subunit 1
MLSAYRQACQLARLLSHLAAAAGELEYVDHYTRDFPTFVPSLPELSKSVLNTPARRPPNLFQWIMVRIRRERSPDDAAGLPPLLLKEGARCVEWSRKIIGFYELLYANEEGRKALSSGVHVAISDGTSSQPEHRMVLAMVAENFSFPDLDRLPCGVSLPMRHVS